MKSPGSIAENVQFCQIKYPELPTEVIGSSEYVVNKEVAESKISFYLYVFASPI